MTSMPFHKPDRTTLLAFFLIVLLGGSNSVAIRFSNQELPPFWGGALRFAAAGLIFWSILWWRKLTLPKLRDALIIALNGFLTVGVSFAFLYWGLQEVPASLATVVIATGPLFTFLFAILHKLEAFRLQVLSGGVVALIGIAVAVNAQPGGDMLIPSLLALFAGAAIAAEGNVIFKILAVKSDPVVINALSLSAGAIFLFIASLIAGEIRGLPSTLPVWIALTYLILGGSVIMFYLFVYLLQRWEASATTYAILLFPIVATVLAALLAGERVTPLFIVGGAIVILGVWLGAFYAKDRA